MTSIELRRADFRRRIHQLQSTAVRLRRTWFRLRRAIQKRSNGIAERLRPTNIDAHDLGRLVAAMTFSGIFIATLLVVLMLLVVYLYLPLAREALHAMGFET